jgi:hypothetical protein
MAKQSRSAHEQTYTPYVRNKSRLVPTHDEDNDARKLHTTPLSPQTLRQGGRTGKAEGANKLNDSALNDERRCVEQPRPLYKHLTNSPQHSSSPSILRLVSGMQVKLAIKAYESKCSLRTASSRD